MRHKCLLVAMVLAMLNQNIIIADNDTATTQTKDVILNGKIGAWKPSDEETFKTTGSTVTGHIPEKEDEYYTIYVELPVSMNFYILSGFSSSYGNFFSPLYKVRNVGNVKLDVGIYEFSDNADETSKLNKSNNIKIGEVNNNDSETQIDLYLKAVEKYEDKDGVSKLLREETLISLIDVMNKQSNIWYKLLELEVGEDRDITFDATDWEKPSTGAGAVFNMKLVFSLHEDDREVVKPTTTN
jgi:hypothetical protein